ncbi:hypothetical protein FJY63_03140 [Candidatus Sumerlaeota bacterium]|nr:hypothetical protein [Candidatus Sumerlaeota bacterium]
MIDAREAVRRVSEYFRDLQVGKEDLEVELEEIEMTEDQKFWLITLSYRRAFLIGPPAREKHYKVFKVDANTGDVMWMRIWRADAPART